MSLVRPFRYAAALLFAGLLFALTASAAMAQDVIPVVGPRLKPPPIPHSAPADKAYLTPTYVYNQPRVAQNHEAQEHYATQSYTPGAGVSRTVTDISNGLTLYTDPNTSFNFNNKDDFSSHWKSGQTDIWTESYSGWGTFAVDDYMRLARNVTFSMERSIGPGRNYGTGYALKIASNYPYAGGWASPLLELEPGTRIRVTVSYLIYNWTQSLGNTEVIHDWASIGVKGDPFSGAATYTNGYNRGEWAKMSVETTVGADGVFMIMLQGESTGFVNSNIYFDNVVIEVEESH